MRLGTRRWRRRRGRGRGTERKEELKVKGAGGGSRWRVDKGGLKVYVMGFPMWPSGDRAWELLVNVEPKKSSGFAAKRRFPWPKWRSKLTATCRKHGLLDPLVGVSRPMVRIRTFSRLNFREREAATLLSYTNLRTRRSTILPRRCSLGKPNNIWIEICPVFRLHIKIWMKRVRSRKVCSLRINRALNENAQQRFGIGWDLLEIRENIHS